MLDHHTGHGFDGDDLGFASQGDLNADSIGAPSRVGDGDAFVGEAGHFGLGAGVVEGEADEALDVGDSVFVVGERGSRGGFSHEAALVETYHVAVDSEFLGGAIAVRRVDWYMIAKEKTPCMSHSNFHSRIETLRVSIENHIHTTSPCSSDDAVDCAEINSHDGHCERLLFCFRY